MVGFSQQTYTTMEDDGAGNGLDVEITVELLGELERPVTLYITAMDGTAVGKCMMMK